jgi:hypothetical protein
MDQLTKSEGRGTLPLDPSLASKLRQHQLPHASPANKEDCVFANPDTGKPYWPGRIQENWLVPAAEKVGIGRIDWHTFGTAIPLCYMRWVWISRSSRSSCGMQIFVQP